MSKPRGQRSPQSSQCDSSTPAPPEDGTSGASCRGGFVKLACLTLLFCIGFVPVVAHAADPQQAPRVQDSAAPREFIRLKPNDKPPVTCDATHLGVLALDKDQRICICSHAHGGSYGEPGKFWWLPAALGQSCKLGTE